MLCAGAAIGISLRRPFAFLSYERIGGAYCRITHGSTRGSRPPIDGRAVESAISTSAHSSPVPCRTTPYDTISTRPFSSSARAS
jgi:hypothetical protein